MKRLSALFTSAAAGILIALLTANIAAALDIRAERYVYGTEAPEAQVLDAHLLLGEHASPVLVQVVSGGWTSSPPEQTAAGLYDPYHQIGFSVVAVCHRTIDANVSWPAPADDVVRAIQFIRDHAEEWNIDPKRISMTGRSSGGHIAMMVGFGKDQANLSSDDPISRHSSAVRCVIQQGGPTNLSDHIRALWDDNQYLARRGDDLKRRIQALLGIEPELVGTDEFYRRLSEISPINLVNRETVPVLMIYTGPEGVTSIDDPRLKWDTHTPISGLVLAEKLEELGVDYELVIGQDLGRSSARSIEVRGAFLKKHNEVP